MPMSASASWRRRAALPRRVGSEAAGDSLTYAADARALAATTRSCRGRSAHGGGRGRVAAVAARHRPRSPAAGGESARCCSCSCRIPSFARLGGVSVRAQCETFIAAAITGGVLLLLAASRTQETTMRRVAAPGCCSAWRSLSSTTPRSTVPLDCARCLLWRRLTPDGESSRWRQASLIPVAALARGSAAGHALGDLYAGDDRLQPALLRRNVCGPLAAWSATC